MVSFHSRTVLPLILTGLLLVAACATAGGDEAVLDRARWQLTAINDQQVAETLAGRAVTIRFEDGEAGGSAGCNSYGGSYEANPGDGSIAFSGVFATLMACEDDAVMQLEARFLQALNSATRYETEGDTLRLFAGDRRLAFTQVNFEVLETVPPEY